MATIGQLKRNRESDTYTGTLRTLTLRADIALRRVDRTSEKAPDYRITADGAEVGAAWIRPTKKGGQYVSLVLDDPSFPAPVWANLGKAPGQDDEDLLAVIWSRPDSRPEA